ncbi:uncharacterized protein LOC126680826 isoform X2 [Mercurialis annua]|uniref:uncharacterized protein LOC126680826 isoform X2 n=1 Tax=Mercurialis annua TaxID=3986 RepID=UPI00215EA734|nr:uncharacterized protein LOC126680826 isoform X2 [Mercurialis annua]
MMSNNFMSQQLPIHSIQLGKVEPMSNKLDHSSVQMGITGQDNNATMSVENMQTGMLGSVALSQQIPASVNSAQTLESMPNNRVLQKLSVANMQMGQMDPRANNLMQQQQFFFHSNMGAQQPTMLTKRKAPIESISNSPGLQKLMMPNKRIAQVEHRPWLQHASTPNKLPVQYQPSSSPSGSQRSQAQFKRSTSIKPGLQQSSAHKTQSGQPSPKVQSESSESMRSRLRESLEAALALVSQEQDAPACKNPGNEDASASGKMHETSQLSGQDSGTAYPGNDVSEEAKGSLPANEDSLASGHSTAHEVSSNNSDELLQGNGLSWVMESDIGVAEQNNIETPLKQQDLEISCDMNRSSAFSSPEVVASEIEKELYKLFGGVNKKYKEKGRSLLFNLKDRNNPELRARVMSGDIPPEKLCSMTAEELASKELSEWRMAKAEELAQMVVLPATDIDMRRLVRKTHKGEFQVEVEPADSVYTEVAIGESSLTQMRPTPKEKEVSSPSKPDKIKEKGNSGSEKGTSDDNEVIMIPSNEGNDLMQGLMVDDELKDVEFLPPIVSLDEFMECLSTEPPFENLPVDSGKTTSISDKDNSQVSSVSKSPDATLRDPDDTTTGKPEATDDKHKNFDTDGISTDNHVKSETSPLFFVPKGERVWEGLLQLNISVMASVICIFKSGEKTSGKDWLGLIEIKGRVRLDAFEKFLQELPMSRSRAVMVVHFICKEGSSKSESTGLKEAADSYIMDSRVGFGEPAPGVELYFCPPHSKTVEMLGKVLPKDQVDALNAIDNGLIGVIVWRKSPPASTVSPKHISKKQHLSSRRTREKDAIPNVNVSAKQPLHHCGRPASTSSKPDVSNDDDDDDLPPGFGPPATREDDDLPEFNFSSGPVTPRSQLSSQGQGVPHFQSLPQAPARPVDQMRELVHKYGQPKTSSSSGNLQDKRGGVVMQPWDDDDDMPEWRPEDNKPQVTHPHPHSHPHLVHGQQPGLHTNIVHETQHQQMARPAMPMLRTNVVQETLRPIAQAAMPLQPQMNVMHAPQNPWQQGPWMVPQNTVPSWQQGPWMVPNPNSGPRAPAVYPPNGGQYYGAPGPEAGQPWRRDAPTSRGF